MVPGSGTTGGFGEQGDFFFFFNSSLSGVNAVPGFGCGFLAGSQVPGSGGEKKPGGPPRLVGPNSGPAGF